MKHLLLSITLAMLLIACSPKTEPNEEDLMPTICEHNEDIIALSSTATLDAATLWQHSLSCTGLVYQNNTITYDTDVTEATLQTGVFELPSYIELVPSWNIILDDNVKVRIKIIPTNDVEDTPFIMAYWTNDYKMSMGSQSSPIGSVSIDTYLPAQPSRYVSFVVEFEGGSFALKSLSVTTKPEQHTFDASTSHLTDLELTVPTKHQMGIPDIGSSICSPTSLAMVLSYYTHDLTPETSAGLVYDEGAHIFGNWSFNASFAGGFEGLNSRVEYLTSLQTMHQYLTNNTPVILSIKTTSKEDLEGALMAYPSGHLIVLTGLKQIDGTWYALVNDPAEYTDAAVPRQYRLDQLLTAMRGYAYIIQSTPLSRGVKTTESE